MSPEQSNEPSIFNHARKIESRDDRHAYLKEACGGDSALRQRIEKLLTAYAAQSQFLEQPAATGPLTVSVGVSVYQGDGRTFFDEADRALYRAKAAGRDCVVVGEPEDGDPEKDEQGDNETGSERL